MEQPPTTAKKVLCIEDEHFIGELYQRALNKGGYDTTVVIDGREALDLALTDQFDIILLDIMIPSVTGFDILKRLRGDNAPQLKAKIIVTTNLEQSEENRAAVERKADGYIVKAEITPKQLVQFLDQLA